jgi:hypothetical protein
VAITPDGTRYIDYLERNRRYELGQNVLTIAPVVKLSEGIFYSEGLIQPHSSLQLGEAGLQKLALHIPMTTLTIARLEALAGIGLSDPELIKYVSEILIKIFNALEESFFWPKGPQFDKGLSVLKYCNVILSRQILQFYCKIEFQVAQKFNNKLKKVAQ